MCCIFNYLMPAKTMQILSFVFLFTACRLAKTERMVSKGISAAAKGKFDKAERYFTRAIKADSSNFDAFFNRGSANNDMHYYTKALDDYIYLRSKNYDNADLYYNMGLSYYDLNKLDSALTCYNTAIVMRSTDFDYYIARGTVFADLKKYQQALADYQKAYALNSKDLIVLKDLGDTYYEIQNWELTKKYILEAIDNGLTEPDYFLKLADCYDKLGDHTNACKYLALARQQVPKGENFNNFLKLNCK